jgi:hypothetical protein
MRDFVCTKEEALGGIVPLAAVTLAMRPVCMLNSKHILSFISEKALLAFMPLATATFAYVKIRCAVAQFETLRKVFIIGRSVDQPVLN